MLSEAHCKPNKVVFSHNILHLNLLLHLLPCIIILYAHCNDPTWSQQLYFFPFIYYYILFFFYYYILCTKNSVWQMIGTEEIFVQIKSRVEDTGQQQEY